ncbi:contractile injection system protein, VgrG/Pvc8 family [Roseospira goensis]|uniref:Phage late control D family protein n=1 Tax=Roseospira goensis TaxID=391922 RepID=A0A7W6S2N2_9PROT|nr:contractile injection system protein, VgrG/Pvc8 family [Roseospira goensis]MBB4287647.1 hypothetical protein [Roseospira goensis]
MTGPLDRPRWTPDWRLSVAGQDITPRVRPVLVSLSVTDHLKADSDELELRLDWRDRAVAVPPRGAALRVALGWRETGLVDMPAFVVDEVQHGNEGQGLAMTIRGRAADLRGPLRAPRSRSFGAPTLGALVARVAADHGLTPVVAPDLAGVAVGHVDQAAESDLHLVTRHARAVGGAVKVADGRLVVARVGSGVTAATGRALPAEVVRHDEALTWWVTSQDRERAASVAAPRHDLDAGRAAWEVVLSDGAGPPVELRVTAAGPAQAVARADGTARETVRERDTLRLTLEGRPTLLAGGDLMLDGFGADADRRWAIQSVTHRLDAVGFRSEVEADTPAPAATPAGSVPRSPGAAAVPGWRVVETADGVAVVWAGDGGA